TTVKRLLVWLAVMGLLPLKAAAQNVTYIHTDDLASPVLETNAQAQVVRQVDYRAYGMEVMDAPRPGPGYTGHYRDVGTGLVYMQQRYYDPVVGMFLSVDPVTPLDKGDMRYFTRYAYAYNNPYGYSDPDGRESQFVHANSEWLSQEYAPDLTQEEMDTYDKMLDEALPKLFSAETGARIMEAAQSEGGLKISLNNDSVTNSVPGSGTINLDPLFTRTAMTTEGLQKAPLEVVIGHEQDMLSWAMWTPARTTISTMSRTHSAES